jgi:H+-transporting ATPase
VLTVAAIQYADVLSVTMAVGAAAGEETGDRQQVGRHRPGVDVLCADKTGTLTQNKLSLESRSRRDPATIILAGALASRAEQRHRSAVIDGLKDKAALKSYQVTHFQPFDPAHRGHHQGVDGSTSRPKGRLRSSCAGGHAKGERRGRQGRE